MALFKIFRGSTSELNQVPCKEGYAYFTEDDGKLYIDIGNNEGDRIAVNAYAASILKSSTNKEINVDDIFLKDMIASVAQGGTGKNALTANALLIGNGTDPIKLVSLDHGDLLIGDATNGVSGLKGVGALFSETAGTPQLATLPVKFGGTGAVTEAAARKNLDVYSKTETDTQIKGITTKAYYETLEPEGWITANNIVTYELSVEDLTCGKTGNIPPIITYTTNKEEYTNIDKAEADPATKKIIFTIETVKNKPQNSIGIIIIDNY